MPYSLHHVKQAFSRQAEDYDKHADLQHSVLFQALRQLEPYFKRDMTLLDAGCGTGFLMELIRHSDISFRVFGCDIAAGMCAKAKKRKDSMHPLEVACADMQALPFADDSMDLAVSSLTMQWLNNSEAALLELHRVLKPGGHALITTFGPMTLQELRESFAGVDDSEHVSRFSPMGDLQAWAEKAGFTLKGCSSEFRCHYYPSVRDLMQEIRVIGAANRLEGRRKTFTGRGRFQKMQKAYRDAHETSRGVPASWEVLYLLLHKKEG